MTAKRIPYFHTPQRDVTCPMATHRRYPEHRHQLRRLRGYDYSRAGVYFITACTHGRANLFGNIVRHEMRLNIYGRMVQEVWNGLPGHYPHVALDAFVIMPNHIHGIVVLATPVGAGFEWGTTGRFSGQFNPRLHRNLYLHRGMAFQKSFGHSKHFPPGKSIDCVTPLVSPCGNAIIMNISSATTPP